MEPVASHAYPGLEVQPDPAPEYARFNQAPLQSVVPQPQPMYQQQHHQHQPTMPEWKDAQTPNTTSTETPTTPTTPKRRILGLTVPVFWTLLVVLVVVIAGAIGGGIGGGLAAQSVSDSLSKSAAAAEGAKPSATTTLAPGEEPTAAAGSGTVTATTVIPIMQPSLIPRDGGCPGINGTPFVSSITLKGQNVAQTFHQRCNTNYAETEENPGLRDLYSAFATSFEECMTWCAQYNEQLQQQQDNKETSGGEGWCTLAAVAKIPGGRCHLKSQGPIL
ncbi:hypothetical protein PG997_000353 [Apiospora hydei]|uniref:Uncharacterized protein n=1 Tax=Apiospora hydei TaxID=1337664 RepID=A0ABR1XAG0_9PEZI